MAKVRTKPTSYLAALLYQASAGKTSDAVAKELSQVAATLPPDMSPQTAFNKNTVSDVLAGRKTISATTERVWARWLGAQLLHAEEKSDRVFAELIGTLRDFDKSIDFQANLLDWITPAKVTLFLPPVTSCFPMAAIFSFNGAYTCESSNLGKSDEYLPLPNELFGRHPVSARYCTRQSGHQRITGPEAIRALITSKFDSGEVGFAVANRRFVPAGYREKIIVLATLSMGVNEKRLLFKRDTLTHYLPRSRRTGVDIFERIDYHDRDGSPLSKNPRVTSSGRIRSFSHFLAYCLLKKGGPDNLSNFKVIGVERNSIASSVMEQILTCPDVSKENTVLGALKTKNKDGDSILEQMARTICEDAILDRNQPVDKVKIDECASQYASKISIIQQLEPDDLIELADLPPVTEMSSQYDMWMVFSPHDYPLTEGDQSPYLVLADDSVSSPLPELEVNLDYALRNDVLGPFRKTYSKYFGFNQHMTAGQDIYYLLWQTHVPVSLIARRDQKHLVAPLLPALMSRLKNVCKQYDLFRPGSISSDPDLKRSFDEYVQELWSVSYPERREPPARSFAELVYKDLTARGTDFNAQSIEVIGNTDLVDVFFDTTR